MSAHTPGPWRVRDGAIYVAETGRIHGGKTCFEAGHSPTECGPSVVNPIAIDILEDVKRGYWDDVKPPSDADLCLIAAAPDLLAALNEVEFLLDGKEDIDDDGGPNIAMKLLPIVRAALAKAGAL